MVPNLKSNKGQAIVEFAFVLPLMVIIVLGIIEFGVLFYNQAVVTNASREGARAGMTYITDGVGYWSEAQMQAKVQQTVSDYLQGRLFTFGPLGSIAITATRSGNIYPDGIDYYDYDPAVIGTVNVVVDYQHTYLSIPSFAGWGNTINISAGATMRLE